MPADFLEQRKKEELHDENEKKLSPYPVGSGSHSL